MKPVLSTEALGVDLMKERSQLPVFFRCKTIEEAFTLESRVDQRFTKRDSAI